MKLSPWSLHPQTRSNLVRCILRFGYVPHGVIMITWRGGHTLGCTRIHEAFPHKLTGASPYQLKSQTR